MNLAKTISLNYGDALLEAWEKECKAIEKKNQELLESAPVVEVPGWEVREYIPIYEEEVEGRWVNSGKKRLSDTVNVITDYRSAWVLGLRLADFPQEGEAVVGNFLVKKAVFKKQQEVELLPLPEKPVVPSLSREGAEELLRNSLNSNGEIVFVYEISGTFYFDVLGGKISLEVAEKKFNNYHTIALGYVFNRGDYPQYLISKKHTVTRFKVQGSGSDSIDVIPGDSKRIVFSRVWLTSDFRKVEPRGLTIDNDGGCGTSLESDGFWNK